MLEIHVSECPMYYRKIRNWIHDQRGVQSSKMQSFFALSIRITHASQGEHVAVKISTRKHFGIHTD